MNPINRNKLLRWLLAAIETKAENVSLSGFMNTSATRHRLPNSSECRNYARTIPDPSTDLTKC